MFRLTNNLTSRQPMITHDVCKLKATCLLYFVTIFQKATYDKSTEFL